MATYLELCQKVLGSSDTGSPDELKTLSDADVYQKGVTENVSEAWRFIQMAYDAWSWRQREFTAQLVAGTDAYKWNELIDGDGAKSISGDLGFSTWLAPTPDTQLGPEWRLGQPPEYLSTGGITSVDFQTMRLRRLQVRSPGAPTAFASAPDLSLLVNPVPNDAYRLHGMYVVGIQSLTSEDHIPHSLPEAYHDVIKWRAVMMIHGSDEASESYHFAQIQYDEIFRTLARLYLPDVTVGGALV